MELHEIAIHGHRIAYRRAGADGPTLLCIHGITQDSSTWEQLGAQLAGEARVIAIDLPGHGASENPPGDHSLGAYASTGTWRHATRTPPSSRCTPSSAR